MTADDVSENIQRVLGDFGLRSTQVELFWIVDLEDVSMAAGIGALEMIHTAPITNDDPLAIAWFDFAVGWLQTHLT
jgi:hypothetical protein